MMLPEAALQKIYILPLAGLDLHGTGWIFKVNFGLVL